MRPNIFRDESVLPELVISIVLAIWLVILVAPAAAAHSASGGSLNYHLIGVLKDPDAPGGYGVRYKVQVKDTGIDNYSINSFVRARASLKTSGNAAWLESGWQDYGGGGQAPISVFALKQGYIETSFPSYSLTLGNSYEFKTAQCDDDTCAKTWIFYGGQWNLLDSTNNSPNCPCLEKAGIWIYKDYTDPPSSHPALSAGVDFNQGTIRKSDDLYYQWNPTQFPLSSFEYTTPYVHCNESAYHAFTVEKDTC